MMEKYSHLLSILEDGYGQEMVQTLSDSIQHYILAMAARSDVSNNYDSENIYNLVWLMKAFLSDCHGVEMK